MLFNDTFDNFSFSTSGTCVQNKEKQRKVVLDFNEANCISFDDSIFLSDTFSFTTVANDLSVSHSNNDIKDISSPTEKPKEQINSKKLISKENKSIARRCSKDTPTKRKGLKESFNQLNVTVNKSEIRSPSTNKSKAENLEAKKKLIFETVNPNIVKPKLIFEIKLDVPKNSNSGDHNLKKLETEENIKLSSWGLPASILQKYESRKITTMFPWQVECLSKADVLEKHKNLVYSAPTSAGKTLVAEILAIKTVLEREKKVLFILPFVSVVREKMFYFQDILGTAGVRVEGFMGSYNPPGGFEKVQVAVCTIEKANSLVNRLLQENKLDQIGAVVVDEMHLLGDQSRGYLLELLLTKLRYMSLKSDEIKIQIIGMSATLPNLSLLAKWLDAELYTTQFRPIPLSEQCIVKGEVYNADLKLERKLTPIPELDVDTDNVLQLCLETILNSNSVLIFCPTKNWCENLAVQISSAFFKLGSAKTELGTKLRQQLNPETIMECLEHLKRCPVGLDDILRKTVSFGVAFHHAGLTMDERDIIEGAFREGCMRVLVATSTLSSGVNLPARRVIIRSPLFYGKPIDTLVYKQMIGRAGRMGRDIAGESILICQPNDYKIAKELMSAHLQPIESCLEGSGKLKRAILEVITSDVASSPDEIDLFTKCTLLANNENEDAELTNPIDEAINFLVTNEFIRLQVIEGSCNKYVATNLAKACLSSSLPPEEGLALFAELEKARQCFVLETELHLIYLVTPYTACNQLGNIDWMLYLDMWEKLSASMKRVGDLVGVKISYIINGTKGKIQSNTAKLYQKLQVHKRFYTALALQDLVNEVPLGVVAAKFNCNRGMLQSLQQTAATFAGMVTAFSKQLGWSSVELIISQFQDRLQFGVSRDLIDLMRLPLLNGQRARCLYNAGIEGIVDLANTDVYSLENVLHKSQPFESEKERDGETEYETEQRNKLRAIWITGKKGVTEREAAEILIRDARKYLQLELGLSEARWDINTQNSKNDSNNDPKHDSSGDTNNDSIHDSNNDSEHDSNNDCEQKNSKNDLKHDSNGVTNNDSKHDSNNDSIHDSSNDCEQDLSNYSKNDSSVDSKHELSRDCSIEIFNSEINLIKPSIEFTIPTVPTPQKSRESLNESKTSSHSYNLRSKSSSANTSNQSLFEDSFTVDSKLLQDISNIEHNISLGASLVEAFQTSQINASQSKRRFNSVNSEEDLFENTPPTKRVKKFALSFLEIVNVCENRRLFECFSKEFVKKEAISMSVGCEKFTIKPSIGKNVLTKKESPEVTGFTYKDYQLKCISVSWGGNCVYYCDFEKTPEVSAAEKIAVFNQALNSENLLVKMFDCKEQIKILARCLGVTFDSRCDDPKVADWLLDPEGGEKSLRDIVLKYHPEVIKMCESAGKSIGCCSLGMNIRSSKASKIRSCVESIISWKLVENLHGVLNDLQWNLQDIYKIEMECLIILAKIEICGFGINKKELQTLADNLKIQTSVIEKEAYNLAGRRFSFVSTQDVAKILGITGRKVSANKQVLEKIKTPMSQLIMSWRKINSTLTKMVYPLLSSIEEDRVHGSYMTFSATGRVSMHELNVQNVPRNFEFYNPRTKHEVQVSCRKVFEAREKCVLVSADYCQLELRLLAHFSQDAVLCRIMRTSEDVFKSIAAKCNDVSVNEVTDPMRQQAKQICYGIIYGMGCKALAHQLEITESDAMNFMETFHEKYPMIKKFTDEIIRSCRENGYVETLAGRRRFLPNIKNDASTFRSQAERQAVNTTIQGSAADIAKKAMVVVNNRIKEKFKSSRYKPSLVLQLHDELLYEVPEKYLRYFGKFLKTSMEGCVELTIPLPIKVKSGATWGEMAELIMNKGITEREAAEILIRDARKYLQLELGLSEARWDINTQNSKNDSNNDPKHDSNGDINNDSKYDSNNYSKHDSSNDCEQDFSNYSKNDSSVDSKRELSRDCSMEISNPEINSIIPSIEFSVLTIPTPQKSRESLNESKTSSHSYNLRSKSSSANTSNQSLFEDSFTVDSKLLQDISNIEHKLDNNISLGASLVEAFQTSQINASQSKRRFNSVNSEEDLFENTPPTKRVKKFALSFLEIVNVCENRRLFECFSKEFVKKEAISMSVGCEKFTIKPSIGKNVLTKKESPEVTGFTYKDYQLKCISVDWGGNCVYYCDFEKTPEVSAAEKIAVFNQALNNENLLVKMFDCKEQIKILARCLGITFDSRCDDPKVADWLLDPEGGEKTLRDIVLKYHPEVIKMCESAGKSIGCCSLGMNIRSSKASKIRSCVESIISWKLVENLHGVLNDLQWNLQDIYKIEMECLIILAKIEICGFGINKKELQTLADNLKIQTSVIEKEAYNLAGRRFSFVSTQDVAKILGITGRKVSANKQVLEKIKTPMSQLIMSWRKINSTLTKMVYPLLSSIEEDRVHGSYMTFSATGRVSMHEPNVQNVPRNFEFYNPRTKHEVQVSCRKVFEAREKCVLVSADYCQLELRLLAHFSQDAVLCRIMRTSEDVFKSIAAKCNDVSVNEVTDPMRQQAKQICYGIIYGMGCKALAHQLEITESDAMNFMETFHEKYPMIKKFTDEIIRSCRENGYVETLAGRRRFLPNIKNDASTFRSQAERQAVNTTIQGSAADIAKKAMVVVNNRIKEKFKSSRYKPALVLQLHDELLYEVPEKYLRYFGKFLKTSMEGCVELTIPLPIKVKSGATWGEMAELIM